MAPESTERSVEYWRDFSKLRIWELTDYEKIIYLDADTLVFDSIDELFERELGELRLVRLFRFLLLPLTIHFKAAAPDIYPPDR